MTSDGTNWTSAAPAGGGAVSSVSGTSPIVVSPTTGATVVSLNAGTNFNFSSVQTVALNDSSNNSVSSTLFLSHNTTGTPAIGLGTRLELAGEYDSGTDEPMSQIDATWSNVTGASRSAYLDFRLINSGSLGSKMRLFPSGGLSVNSTTDPGTGVINTSLGYKAAGAEFPVASNGIVTRTAANTYIATPTTGSGNVVLDSAPTLTNPVVGTQSASDNSTKAASTAYVTSAVSTSGGWTIYKTVSEFTTSSFTAVDITGLQTGTLAGATLYEIEFLLYGNVLAGTAGAKIAFHDGGSGGGNTIVCHAYMNGATPGANIAGGVNAFDTLSAVAFWVGSGVELCGFGKGIYKSSTTSPTLSLQIAKVTSSSVTVHVGSMLKIRPV
jgi:hypothetical protein